MSETSLLLDFYYSNLYDKLSRLVQPLNDHFAIDDFTYIVTTSEGYLSCIGNNADVKICYNSNLCFVQCPFFCHPDNYYHNQYIITGDWPDEKYHQSQAIVKDNYGLENFLVICRKQNDCAHLFVFSSSKADLPLNSVFINNLSVFNSFSDYFLNEWTLHSQLMERYTIDIRKFSDNAYFQKPLKPFLSNNDRSKMQFLQKIQSLHKIPFQEALTKREIECSKLFVLGYSSRKIAKQLEISPRTVEHHIENIKAKLSSHSKSELLSLLQQYQSHDLLSML